MMVTMPSIAKNTISSKVSDTAPLTGHPSRTMPAAIASTADISDHQKPGACRAMKVVIRPTTPLMSSSQAMKIATASVATTGTTMAKMPSTISTMPSIRNRTQ